MTTDFNMTQSNDMLLFDYAAGNLTPPLALAVSVHRALSPRADTLIREYESVGGEMLAHDCAPASLRADALEACLARLDQPRASVGEASSVPLVIDGVAMPQVLARFIQDQNIEQKWSNVTPGIRSMDLGFEDTTRIQLLKIAPNTATPDHGHRGTEITVILDGAFHDGDKRYNAGDMIVEDEDSVHAPIADAHMGCMCLVVTTAPIRLTGFLGALINPFLR
jgi:putative transcriptional regulator